MTKPRSSESMTHSFNHVMTRGNNKLPIFFQEQDYLQCYKILSEITEKYNCKVHCFCLMTNHIHLLIENFSIPLQRIMQAFLSSFAGYQNRRHDRVGHLFQGPYIAKAVKNIPYCLELFYYIHNNPVAANLVSKHSDYTWSSYNYYQQCLTLPWLTTDFLSEIVLSRFSSYDSFFEAYSERETEPEYCSVDASQSLIVQRTNKSKASDLKMLRYFTFKEICQIVCDIFNISLEQLSSISKAQKLCQARAITAYYAHFYAGFTLKYIGIQFERNEKSFSKVMYRIIKDESICLTIKRVETEFKKAFAEKNLQKVFF